MTDQMTATTATAADTALGGATGPPREEQQRAGLARMKLVATSLLVVAAIVFVIAKSNEDGGAAWVGYVRAVAEAAMVGALADWFAVTALFRHPLRIPIPHTAIIPRRKDDIGRSLGTFVESNFLTVDVIDERIRQAQVGRRLGEWLADPLNAERATDGAADVLRGALDVLDDDEIQAGLESIVRRRLDATEVSPLVGKALDLTIEGGHHQQLLDAVLVGLANFLADNRDTFRNRLYEESPWWVPEGIDDRVYAKIDEVANRFIADVLADQHHELRRSVDRRGTEFARRLADDPTLVARGEQLKAELIEHPEVRRWIDSLWTGAKRALVEATEDDQSELRARTTSSLVRLGHRLTNEPELQRKVDEWVARAVAHLVENYRSEVGDIIESTVAKWDGAATAEKLELQVGRDLQFIRINGTVVGGLAGFVIHAIGEML